MRPLALLALIVLCLTACAPPVIQIPVGAAAVGYANGVGMYATGKSLALQLRKEGKIDDPAWEELKALDTRAGILKGEIEKALLNPVQPIDYEKILQYTNNAMDMLIKLGVTVAK